MGPAVSSPYSAGSTRSTRSTSWEREGPIYTGDNGSVSEFGALFTFVHTKAVVLRAQFSGFGTTPDSAKSGYEAVTEEYDVMLNSALNSLAKS